MDIGGSISGALFNDDSRSFRYSLWRIWEKTGDYLLFIGLNPSTASRIKDDPTIRRMVGFAKTWGFGGLYVGNLFSLVSANPDRLTPFVSTEYKDKINDEAIKRMRELSTLVLVGWGGWGVMAGIRPQQVISLVGEPVYCLNVNKSGEPTHPLYLPSDTKLTRYYRKIQQGIKAPDWF